MHGKMAELIIHHPQIEMWQYSNLINTEIVILNGVKYVGKHAFSDSMYLKEVIINGNQTILDIGCFSYCQSLNKVSLIGVDVLGKAAFAWCTNISKLFLDVEYVKEGCFFHCSNLTEVIFSERIKIIEQRSFAACNRLKNVSFLGKTPQIGRDCFFHTNL